MSNFERYARQMRFAPLGEAGQERLAQSRVLICGCGALGTVLANTLVRAGVGHVRIVDRDFVELNNLQRQVLFDESDVASAMPKAVAAAEKLRRINSEIEIEAIVADLTADNALALADGVDCIVDGTDNFETRFLLNDVSLRTCIPWVFGGCLGSEGQSLTIVPGETPCLRCVIEEPPPPGASPTCDTAGIVGPIISVIASIQAMEAIKLLSGHREAIQPGFIVVDLWDTSLRQMKLAGLKRSGKCPACDRGELDWLDGRRSQPPVVLCGRNAVQVSPPPGPRMSIDALAARLESAGRVTRNAFLVRLAVDPYLITVFADGRAIIGGTDDVATARSVYARYIGS